jgi:hypothetical protein
MKLGVSFPDSKNSVTMKIPQLLFGGIVLALSFAVDVHAQNVGIGFQIRHPN